MSEAIKVHLPSSACQSVICSQFSTGMPQEYSRLRARSLKFEGTPTICFIVFLLKPLSKLFLNEMTWSFHSETVLMGEMLKFFIILRMIISERIELLISFELESLFFVISVVFFYVLFS